MYDTDLKRRTVKLSYDINLDDDKNAAPCLLEQCKLPDSLNFGISH